MSIDPSKPQTWSAKLHSTQRIKNHMVTFGCDPELFLEKDGKVIGSEKVIPEGGFHTSTLTGSKFVRDGVQIEMNPRPDTCRARLSNDMATSFVKLKELLQKENVNLSFNQVVTVPKKELDSLAPGSRVLGCAPSNNLYKKDATIAVNVATYRKRSAGGHLHFGLHDAKLKEYIPDLVRTFDLLIGNTAVLIDRDPNAHIRRRVYGRAGEHRIPSHGVEYRTLSNWWLRSYQLMSLVMGLGRLAVSVVATDKIGQYTYSPGKGYGYTQPKWAPLETLFKDIDPRKVEKAINTNDLDLAKENFEPVREYILRHVPYLGDGCGLWSSDGAMQAFDYFTAKVQSNGLEYWFPQDPLTHWTTKAEGHGTGWESFLTGKVLQEYTKAKADEAAAMEVRV